MATRAQVKAEIDRHYAILERECARDGRADRLLYDAYRFAVEGEKQHRRGSFRGIAKCKQSVETAAKYYVLQAFIDPSAVSSVLAASELRLDRLYGSALRSWLDKRNHSSDCSGSSADYILGMVSSYTEIDYIRDIA